MIRFVHAPHSIRSIKALVLYRFPEQIFSFVDSISRYKFSTAIMDGMRVVLTLETLRAETKATNKSEVL